MKVFLSVGSTYNELQEEFIKAFEVFLSQNGCERLTVGRGHYTSKQPVVEARNLMQTADGVVVIAFTRQIIEKAINEPGGLKENFINNRKLPTIWNQLEAAMAFGLGLPLLLIIEDGLYQEAMLKDRLEYRALITKLDKTFFQSDEFKGIFIDWKNIAENQTSTNKQIDIKTLTIGKLVSELSPEQFWKVGVVIFSIISAVAGAAFWIAKHLVH
jgi:hypothetical protein